MMSGGRAQAGRVMVGSICDHGGRRKIGIGVVMGVMLIESVRCDAISLLSVARSLLKAADALASSLPAGDPVFVSEA